MKQAITVLFAVCSLFAAAALGQNNEITGVIGRTFVSDQGILGSTSFDRNVHFGKGTTFEINYARSFLSSPLVSLALEVPFLLNPDQDLHAAPPTPVPQKYSSFLVTPSAKVTVFPTVAVSPWASCGGGVAHFGESSTTVFGLKNTGSKGTSSGVLQVGAGLDVKFVSKFRLRFEVRDFWSGTPQLNVNTGKSRQHNIFVGAGLVYRF